MTECGAALKRRFQVVLARLHARPAWVAALGATLGSAPFYDARLFVLWPAGPAWTAAAGLHSIREGDAPCSRLCLSDARRASLDRGFGRCVVMKKSGAVLKRYQNRTMDRVVAPALQPGKVTRRPPWQSRKTSFRTSSNLTGDAWIGLIEHVP